MRTKACIDWSDVEDAARQLAAAWRSFDSFAWSRGYDLEDADKWCIWYTSHRDAGLLAQSNEQAINERLEPFSEGDDPDLVFETHSHWLCGFVMGFSVRVYRTDDTITDAFREFCSIQEQLEAYPVLDESHYSELEYTATLENYRSEMWRHKNLPEGWESDCFSWFCDNGHDRFIENRDDQGGYAPEEKIIEALQDLGLWPDMIVDANGGNEL